MTLIACLTSAESLSSPQTTPGYEIEWTDKIYHCETHIDLETD